MRQSVLEALPPAEIRAPIVPAIDASPRAIRRTMSASYLNEVANHPEVHRWLYADGPVDLSEIIDNPANVALEADGGGFICIHLSDGIYEVHSLFLPEARGSTTGAMAAGMEYMFLRTDCFRLVTRAPFNNADAAAIARKGGFREWFRREDAKSGDSAYLSLEIDEWIQRSPRFEAEGHWFHDQLSASKQNAAPGLPQHPADPAHDRAVGAAVAMFRTGNIGKGIGTYNRWAAFAGYAPIRLISTQPITIDVVDAIVELNGRTMEIVLCR